VRRDVDHLALWCAYVDVCCLTCEKRADAIQLCPCRLRRARPIYCHGCALKLLADSVICAYCRGNIDGVFQLDPAIQYVFDSPVSSSTSSCATRAAPNRVSSGETGEGATEEQCPVNETPRRW
jgi:hypothetical protein